MPSTEHPASEAAPAPAAPVFSRIVVGVDCTEAGFEACRQAGRLAEPSAAIDAVAVVHLADAVQTGVYASGVADELRRDAEAALDVAAEILGERAERRFVNGYITPALLHETERANATVIAIGTHGHHRATEILIGGVAGDILHQAPCAVLVARPPQDPLGFPRSIVVGFDGSACAGAALEAAQHLAARFDIPLRTVTAVGGEEIDLELVRRRVPLAESDDEQPVDALVQASETTDLVVVGSRGLHGMKALGSVSERVAHEAACSVLVVR